MKIDKKKYKTVSAHISIEINRKLEKKAAHKNRSVSYTIGRILESYVKPKGVKIGKGVRG